MVYLVRKVRKESVRTDGVAHEHIIGVITSSGIYYSNQRVAASIAASDEWLTDAAKPPRARIEVVAYCPFADCYHGPYLRVQTDRPGKNDLESLPLG